MAEERITAWLRIRDKVRFKAGMRDAARSVDEFGDSSEGTALKLELLKQISDRLEIQTRVLIAGFSAEARAIDEVGDQASQTTRRLLVMNAVQNRSNSILNRNITSWKFWKDRLSLTSAEIMSTVATILGYLLPALVAMTASLAGAAIGGAAVLTSALGALGVGLAGTGIIAATVAGQYGKIKQAQDALTLATEQYGAGSKEAARASGKLFATIRTQGGRQVWNAVRAVDSLKKAWAGATGPARASLVGTLTSGVGAARSMLPTFAGQTNLNAAAVQRGAGNIFGALSGGEARKTLVQLSKTFRAMSGPGSRGAANALIVLMRIMRAAAPWAVKWALSWESTTKSWERGTRDSGKLEGNINMLVGHFKAWWGLAKALSRTLGIIFQGTNQEGRLMVQIVTEYVNKFNTWLDMMVRTGQMQQLVEQYGRSIGYLFTALGLALTHPTQFIDKYLPIWSNAIAQAAGSVVLTFLKAWWNAGLWGKLFIAFMLGKWLFGVNLFAILARAAGARFVTAFGLYAAPRLAVMFAAQGAIGAPLIAAGTALGMGLAGAILAGVLLVPLALGLQKWVNDAAEDLGISPKGGVPKPFNNLPGDKNIIDKAKDVWNNLPFKGSGGLIPSGTAAWVGDRGPELAVAGVGGTMIHPMGSTPPIAQPQHGALAVSDILRPVHVHVDVDRREIGRANVNWKDDRKSLRGER